jgi:hypothetical protein
MISATLISTYFLRLPTCCICLRSYQHHCFRRNSSSASSLQLTHSTMSQSYFPTLRVTLNVFPILCFQAPQKWCHDGSHCWTGLPPTHTNTKNTYCLPSSYSPQHNHAVFFQLLTSYCKSNQSFVSSQTQATDLLIADLILEDLQNTRTQTAVKTTLTSTKSRSVYI